MFDQVLQGLLKMAPGTDHVGRFQAGDIVLFLADMIHAGVKDAAFTTTNPRMTLFMSWSHPEFPAPRYELQAQPHMVKLIQKVAGDCTEAEQETFFNKHKDCKMTEYDPWALMHDISDTNSIQLARTAIEEMLKQALSLDGQFSSRSHVLQTVAEMGSG